MRKEVSNKEDWENGFSNPNEPSIDGFRYLVHAVAGKASKISQMIYALSKDNAKIDNSQHIDLLINPEKISDKKIISASVIENDKSATFAEVGFILRCPHKNVLKMSCQDNGTNFTNIDMALSKLSQEKVIMNLDSLMEGTNGQSGISYNEVVLAGETDAGKVEIVGIFIKNNKKGFPVDKETAGAIRSLSYRLNVPVVEMETSAPQVSYDEKTDVEYYESHITDYGMYAYNDSGNRFIMSVGEMELFVYYHDETGNTKKRPMTKSEAKTMLDKIEEDIASEDLKSLTENRAKIDEKIESLPEVTETKVNSSFLPQDIISGFLDRKLEIKSKPDFSKLFDKKFTNK